MASPTVRVSHEALSEQLQPSQREAMERVQVFLSQQQPVDIALPDRSARVPLQPLPFSPTQASALEEQLELF